MNRIVEQPVASRHKLAVALPDVIIDPLVYPPFTLYEGNLDY